MKVQMTRTAAGSPDGIEILEYEEGVVYDVPADLARAFVNDEAAEALEELPELEPVEEGEELARRRLEKAAPADGDVDPVEELRAELKKLTVPVLKERAAEASVELADGAKKDAIIEALVAAATAPAETAEPETEPETTE